MTLLEVLLNHENLHSSEAQLTEDIRPDTRFYQGGTVRGVVLPQNQPPRIEFSTTSVVNGRVDHGIGVVHNPVL